MRKPAVLLVFVSLLAISLAGCSAPTQAPAAPSADASADPDSAPEATTEPAPEPDPAPEAASVVVSVDGFALLADDGTTIAEFGYFDADAAPAIAALTAAFGTAPAASRDEAVTHFPASANSDWAGFELRDLETETSFPEYPNYMLRITTAQSSGVDIRTTDGVYVGMASTELEPLSHRNWIDTGGGTEKAMFLLEQKPVEGIPYADYEPAALSVGISASSPDGVVERIMAPSANWGA